MLFLKLLYCFKEPNYQQKYTCTMQAYVLLSRILVPVRWILLTAACRKKRICDDLGGHVNCTRKVQMNWLAPN